MTERKPARDGYDAVVDLFPPKGVARSAYALVRRTYRIAESGRMSLEAPVPIAAPAEGRGPLATRWGDVSFARTRTDVAVRGHAYAPGSRLATRMAITLSVGDHKKRIEVFGRRVIEWTRGRPRFSDPEPFSFVPVTLESAYGGLDPRLTERDDGYRYPRNPVGKGYLVGREPAVGLELPNLEDPERLLTPASVFVDDPRDWWRQPLPACFEPASALAFPRSILSGAELALPPPADAELEEVRRGSLPRDWRALAAALAHDVPPIAFAQSGPHGQVFDALAPDAKIAVHGMHPSRERFEVAVPPPPRVAIEIDAARYDLAPRLVSVLLEPSEERASFTWSAVLPTLPRLLMPTLHAAIPLAARVDGDEAIEYVAPPTLRERIEAIVATIRAGRRQQAIRDTIPPPSAQEVELERETDPGTVDVDPPGAPPRLGRIADVEAFEAPYEAPAGARSEPARAPAWRGSGEHTGRLTLPGEERPALVPKTLQIALPEARGYATPETRADPAPELKPEKTVIWAELPSKRPPLAEEQTRILRPPAAPIAAPSRHPLEPSAGATPSRLAAERTQILTEAQLRAAGSIGPKRDAPRSLHEETTSVLAGAPRVEAGDARRHDPRSEAVFLDEPDELAGGGTQVLHADELLELDDD